MKVVESKKPILSIAIPTRNRQLYAVESIRTILSIIDNDIEVVVQDNSDDSSLESMLPNDSCSLPP